MTGLGKMPENDPKMAKFGFSANNFGTEGPRDLKFGLLASPGVGLPRTGIKKNRVPVFYDPTVCLVVLKGKKSTIHRKTAEKKEGGSAATPQ